MKKIIFQTPDGQTFVALYKNSIIVCQQTGTGREYELESMIHLDEKLAERIKKELSEGQ